MHKFLRHPFAATAALTSLLLAAGAQAQEAALPETMNWTSYDVGSAGYAEASAIADAFGKDFGTRIRIQPSGTAVGRLEPILRGRANIGFLATEAFFAAEGTEDFAARRWGPQDIRTLGGRPSSSGIFTAADAEIETLKDLKGKRFAYAAGNPSMNVKCNAFLSFAGLSEADVIPVVFPTYAAAMRSLAEGKADASCSSTTPSQLYELQESPRGLHWLAVDPEDAEGWKRLKAVAPFFAPYEETVGAGISDAEPVDILAWRYPVLIVRADASEDEVYNFLKAMDESYPLYKDGTSVMPRWDLDIAGTPPIDVPFHPGAIKYLKERGTWTDEMTAWNDGRLARLQALRAAWNDAIAEGEGKSDEDFAKIWATHRQAALDNL